MRLVDNRHFLQGEKRAKKIAKILKIPFLVLDFKKEFKKRIINYFLEQCKNGQTPNPCVVCNKEIKFGILLEKALDLGADYIATGHYAKLKEVRPRSIYKVYKGIDKEKDQSYFLWTLTQKQLKYVLFPNGNYTKSQVKKMAKKFKLPVFDALESQEICFIQKTTNDFLKKHLGTRPGQIINTQGKVTGSHQGLYFYTIGQRKGIKLSQGPYYVLAKDLKRNILIVTKNERDLFKKELIAKKVNWISGKIPKFPLKIKAKIRYRSKSALATIYKMVNSKYKIVFNSPQRAVTTGQSVVFYKGNELVGGGIIC